MKTLTESLQVKQRVISKLLEIDRTVSALEAVRKDLIKSLDADMTSASLDTIDDTLATITRVAAVEKVLFDSKKFKEENEDLYTKYTKTSKAKASLRVTWKVATEPEVMAADASIYIDTI
jgi:predicted phage-related endonuclease